MPCYAIAPPEACSPQVLMAAMHLISLLSPRTRKLLLRSTAEQHDTTTPTTTVSTSMSMMPTTSYHTEHRLRFVSSVWELFTPRVATSRYTNMMSQRRVRTWKGLSCFTGRVLARTGYLQRPARDIMAACTTLVRWWEAEGRPRHLHLRPANAFTAHLSLLYTSLGINDPIYNTACRQLGLTEPATVQPTSDITEASVPHPRDTETDAIPVMEVWRSFTRRFPTL